MIRSLWTLKVRKWVLFDQTYVGNVSYQEIMYPQKLMSFILPCKLCINVIATWKWLKSILNHGVIKKFKYLEWTKLYIFWVTLGFCFLFFVFFLKIFIYFLTINMTKICKISIYIVKKKKSFNRDWRLIIFAYNIYYLKFNQMKIFTSLTKIITFSRDYVHVKSRSYRTFHRRLHSFIRTISNSLMISNFSNFFISSIKYLKEGWMEGAWSTINKERGVFGLRLAQLIKSYSKLGKSGGASLRLRWCNVSLRNPGGEYFAISLIALFPFK